MDLKSMLNDSAAQRPATLHTPHSSYDARANEKATTHESHSRSQSHGQPQRPQHYPPPLQPIDSRGHSAGGYFGLQSPHPNHLNSASTHASTPSVGPHSAYARSPGSQSQVLTPRESAGSHGGYNPSFVPSPSLSVNQPPTPGSAYTHQSHTPLSAHHQSGHPSAYSQAQSPRGSHPPNGQQRQLSPNAPHPYNQPATPLGPPVKHNKFSPQAQRPTSQGVEQHYRKSSHGSVGSMPGREHNAGPQQQIDAMRPENVQRQSLPEVERSKEREQSLSVSPKTIPQPSPYRQMSVSSTAGSQGRPSVQSPPETRIVPNISDIAMSGNSNSSEVKVEHQQTPTSRSSTIPIDHQRSLSRGPLVKQETPEMNNSPASQPTLKRNASVMSDRSPASHMQPRKRPKRSEMPIFAQSARQKALRLSSNGQKTRSNKPPARTAAQQPPPPPSLMQQQTQQSQQPQMPPQSTRNATPVVANGKLPSAPTSTPPQPAEVTWEPSIANITPYEDLTRRVCDWIFATIGSAVPPSGGAMFEIEAKIGEIFDVHRGTRVTLAVDTEAIFSKTNYGSQTKFESSMNMEQHMLLNKYLNELTREAFLQAQKGERQEIVYDHPHEIDEFFELTPEGQQNLNPSIVEYLQARHRPRVRRTRDRDTGQLKAQIIKSRIADMEIYNPNTDFDCRISISIESPWEGNPNWLTPMGDGNEGRHKDRMSYRHMAYQIDLTQVSHDNNPNMEHELEVEISTEQIRRELDNLQNGRPSKYEDLVRGLIDNVRLLCRKGSVTGPRRG